MTKEGFVRIRLEDIVKISRPREQTKLKLIYSIAGSDEERVQAASESLDDLMSSLGATSIERGSRDSNQFFFSEKTWTAPWTPEGPTPPWAQNPDDN